MLPSPSPEMSARVASMCCLAGRRGPRAAYFASGSIWSPTYRTMM
jgi:hypothetical protein